MRHSQKRKFFSYSDSSPINPVFMVVSFLMIFGGLWGISGFAEKTVIFLVYFNPNLTPELLSNISGIFVFVGSMLLTVQAFLTVRNEKKSIQEKQKRDEALLLSIVDGIIATDEDGRIVFMNPQAEKMLSCGGVRCVGNNVFRCLEFFDEQEKRISKSAHPLQKIYVKKEDAEPFIMKPKSFLYLKQNDFGKKLPVSLNAAPVIIDGFLRGVVIALRDITKEKEIDEMKSNFVSIAAHQLRTPLGAVRWNIELLMEEMHDSLSEAVSATIGNIRQTNLRMIGLVDELLNVSRIEEGRIENKPERFLPARVISSVIEDLAPEIEKLDLTIFFDMEKNLSFEIETDPRRFRDVVQNLLSNATRYNTLHGSVSVNIKKEVDELVFSVSDTGIGIPEAEKEKIFSRFFRGSHALLSSTDGSGLGLFIVKSYVEKWGGTIWFESEKNKGTTFYFSVPLHK